MEIPFFVRNCPVRNCRNTNEDGIPISDQSKLKNILFKILFPIFFYLFGFEWEGLLPPTVNFPILLLPQSIESRGQGWLQMKRGQRREGNLSVYGNDGRMFCCEGQCPESDDAKAPHGGFGSGSKQLNGGGGGLLCVCVEKWKSSSKA